MDEIGISEKTNAILRLANLDNEWKGWIIHNEEKERMKLFLDQVAEDIYQGYVTYDAFEDIFITVSERVGKSKGDYVDDCIIYIKKKIISKYKRIDYIS